MVLTSALAACGGSCDRRRRQTWLCSDRPVVENKTSFGSTLIHRRSSVRFDMDLRLCVFSCSLVFDSSDGYLGSF